jgi:hypothetical protein
MAETYHWDRFRELPKGEQLRRALEACVESLRLIPKEKGGEWDACSHPANSLRMARIALEPEEPGPVGYPPDGTTHPLCEPGSSSS